MKTIHIVNGPNLNMLGSREPEIYGSTTFEDYLEKLRVIFPSCNIIYFQSNHEGELIDYLQDNARGSDGVVINAGALSHYSYAIADTIKAIAPPVIEVHISQIATRESHRHITVLTDVCAGMIMGLGLDGYRLAIAHLTSRK